MDLRLRGLAALAVAAGTLSAAGCGADAICGSDSYPVIQVGGSGSACQVKGREPQPGYTRFPAGKEPRRVGDTWDVYWQTHTVNRAGEIVEL